MPGHQAPWLRARHPWPPARRLAGLGRPGAGNHPDRMMPGALLLATVTIDDDWQNAQGWSHG
jgi:hypothetical protein